MNFWNSQQAEVSQKKAEKPQVNDRKSDRPISPDLVGLNHKLLEEISQVQLKMVDILQENVRLKSEIDQLKKLVIQIETHMQEVGPVEELPSKRSSLESSLSRRSSSAKQPTPMNERPRSDPGSRNRILPPVPPIVGKFEKLSDLGRSMKEMEALVQRIAETHEPDGVLPTNPSRLMKFLPAPPAVIQEEKPSAFLQEYFKPVTQDKIPEPLIKSPFLSRISMIPQENILESSPSLIDRLRSNSFLATPRIGGFAIPVMAVMSGQAAQETLVPITITDQRVALSSESKALLEEFAPGPSDSPPAQEEEERPAPPVKPIMKANSMFRRSRLSDFSADPATTEPTANTTDLPNIAEADGGIH